MTTSPDSVAYPQSVAQVIPPSEAAPWDWASPIMDAIRGQVAQQDVPREADTE